MHRQHDMCVLSSNKQYLIVIFCIYVHVYIYICIRTMIKKHHTLINDIYIYNHIYLYIYTDCTYVRINVPYVYQTSFMTP